LGNRSDERFPNFDAHGKLRAKMSDLLEIIKSRRSVRRYQGEEVPDEAVTKCLEAARWAPSAVNNQPWRFVVIRDSKLREEIGETLKGFAAINSFVGNAPLIFVLYTESSHRWVELDCGMASQNLMLEAHSLGLGTCFIGAYNEKAIKDILGLSEKARIMGLIACGFPAEQPSPRSRLPLEKLVSYDRYFGKAAQPSFFKRLELGLASLFFKRKGNV